MSNLSNSVNPNLKLAAIVLAAAVVTGCVSAKSKPTEPAEPAAPAPAATTISVPETITRWTVVAGNHLWGISGTWEVFNLPEKWPLLYKANLDQIEDADLIFPGQVLEIPRDSSVDEIEDAIQHAKTRGSWALGPVELSDQEYLKNSP